MVRACASSIGVGRGSGREQREHSTRIVGVENRDRSDHHQKADAGETNPVLVQENARAMLARRPVHDLPILGVDAKGQRRRSIGDKIDPQQLCGKERQE